MPLPARWQRPAVKGWLALLAVYVFWGSTYLAIRVGVQHFPPLLLSACRYLLPGAILYAATWRSAAGRPVHFREWRSAAVLGFLLLLGGNGSLTLGEQTIPSGIASLLVAAVPFWMVLFDALSERRLVNPLVVSGLIVGWLGILLLVRPGGTQPLDLKSVGAVLVGGLMWAAGSICSRSAPQAQPALRGIAMQMLAGGIWLGLAGVVSGELPQVRWSAEALFAMLWLSSAGAIVGFSAYIYALKVLPTPTVSTYAFVNPIIAVLLGWALLREAITGSTLLAMLVIIVGVALILLARARMTSPKPPPETDYA